MNNLMRLKGGQYVFSSGVRIYSRVLLEKTARNSLTASSNQSKNIHERWLRKTRNDRVSLIKQCNQNIKKHYS